jgi:hypothetical protein
MPRDRTDVDVRNRSIDMLRRRASFLEQQLAYGKGAPGPRAWMKAEIAALYYAIDYIERNEYLSDGDGAQRHGGS